RQVAEDVAERDDARAEVRHLDPDGLFAGDRGQDANLGRREGVAQVVLQVRHFADLGAGRELELVPGDAWARDLADDGRLDAEVREAGDERVRDPRGRLAVRADAGPRAHEHAPVGQPVVGGRGGQLEQLLLRLVRRRLVGEGRRLGADEIRVVLLDVDGR